MSPITRAWQRDLDQAEATRMEATEFKRGDKVRRIDEPYVRLIVREVDPEGAISGVPKALCFNSYGHGKWMAINDLEIAS